MNDLGLDLNFSGGIRTRGRAAKPVAVAVERDLTPDDLEYLATIERGTTAPDVKKLRDRHHALAKCIAQGMKDGDAAIMCDYDISRVSILKGDPAFQELVAFYRKGVEEQYYGMHEKLAGIASDALSELSDRIEDKPEDFSVGQLMELTKLGADRTGHGPSTKTEVDVRHGIADKMDRARQRALAARQASAEQGIGLKDITPEN